MDTVRRRIAHFCAQGGPHDLALLYLSCHGVLDDRGRLYYATVDTERELLSVTAVPAAWLTEHLDDCKSRQQILVLDCCHSGAFARGAKGSGDLALQERVEGRGRVVLTASRATEYSFEGDQVIVEGDQGIGKGASSVFTGALVKGLETGAADTDGNGRITVNELYDFAYQSVKTTDARQNPGIWSFGAEGTLVVAQNPRGPVVKPSPLPEHLVAALESPGPRIREGAVAALADLLAGDDKGRALTARQRLEHIAEHDIRAVADRARLVLEGGPELRPAAGSATHEEQRRSQQPAPPVNRGRRPAESSARRLSARRPTLRRDAQEQEVKGSLWSQGHGKGILLGIAAVALILLLGVSIALTGVFLVVAVSPETDSTSSPGTLVALALASAGIAALSYVALRRTLGYARSGTRRRP